MSKGGADASPRSARGRSGEPWLVAAALVACAACSTAPERPRPNIVVLIADDQSGRSLGAEGDAFAHTPRLDRLAAEGVHFTNSFVTTSLCSPSRASFLTGRYARRHGVADNRTRFPQDVETFASLLGASGYDTAYIGKWHLGRKAAARPGFGYTASFAGQGVYFDCPFFVEGAVRKTRGHVDDVATDFAVEFVERPRSGPFLVVLGFKGAHIPREPPARFATLYRDVELPAPPNLDALPPYPRHAEYDALAERSGDSAAAYVVPEDWERGFDRSAFDVPAARRLDSARKYYRSLAGVDDSVGRVLDALDATGVAEDTVVVYVSDNGTHLYAHGMVGKRSAYEESMRVVTLARYPRRFPGARRVDALVLNVDLAPTLLDLAGVEAPPAMQGRSWRRLAEGDDEAAASWRDAFVYEYYRGEFPFVPSLVALRTRTRKLVRYDGYPGWTELFDLESDPFELRDLARQADRAGEVEQLSKRLDALEREIGPRLRPWQRAQRSGS